MSNNPASFLYIPTVWFPLVYGEPEGSKLRWFAQPAICYDQTDCSVEQGFWRTELTLLGTTLSLTILRFLMQTSPRSVSIQCLYLTNERLSRSRQSGTELQLLPAVTSTHLGERKKMLPTPTPQPPSALPPPPSATVQEPSK